MSYDKFAADERTRDAVIRNIEIIGEAGGAAEGGHGEGAADPLASDLRHGPP